VVVLEDIDARDSMRASEDDSESLAQSAEHTAAGALRDPTAPSRVEVGDPQLAADLTSDPANSIDGAIDQITAELAAFCFEQLERSVTSHDALDLNTDTNGLEDEFRVRHYLHYIARRSRQYIQYLQTRSFRRSQITHKLLPRT
jgi:hypothetical protein